MAPPVFVMKNINCLTKHWGESQPLKSYKLTVFVSRDKNIHKYQMCVLLVLFKRAAYLPGQILTSQKVHSADAVRLL